MKTWRTVDDDERADAPQDGAWHVISRKPLLTRRYVTVWEERVRLDDGQVIDDFCRIDSPDWCAVVCLTREGRVALVRQYRHGVGRQSLELPAGGVEPSESPLDAARRELLEETGLWAPHWQPLISLAVDPSRQRVVGHFYVALQAEVRAAPSLDPGERLETLLLEPNEMFARLERGEIFHGLHVAALLQAKRQGVL